MSYFFENLPSELMEMIFRYLSGCDLYFSFGNLNYRFNTLLANYRYYSLDFRYVSKMIFDSMIEYIQPSHIYALTLSNSIETIGQIDLFLSYWKLSDFINLRSLHLHRIDHFILTLVQSDIMKLSNLLILRIDGCQMDDDSFLEQLSQLPHLQYLYIPDFNNSLWSISPLLSNKLVHIDIYCHSQDISYVFNSGPSLRSINLVIDR
jgi:hypothetical protein